MKKNQIIFFGILLLLVLFIIILIYYFDGQSRNDFDLSYFQPRTVNDLKINYQNQLLNSLTYYLNQAEASSNDFYVRQGNIKKLTDQIIALVVPGDYKDLHLNLIIALTKLQSQAETDQQSAREMLIEQIKKYPWLSSALSVFLINNQ